MENQITAINFQNRRRWLALAAITAGGLSGVVQNVLALGLKPVPPGVYRVKGDVRINGQTAREGMPIGPGDTVSTGPGAEAVVVIGQDAFLQRERSVVRFGADALAGFMRVVTGSILSVFGRGEKTLHTPTASIGIRGTGCYIEAMDPKKTYFCLCYGVAEIRPSADPSHVETIVTQHHDHPVFIHHDDAMPMMVTAPVFNHSDQELTLLENLTGRWPPFYGNSTNYY